MNSTFWTTSATVAAVAALAFALTTGAIPPLEAAVTHLADRPLASGTSQTAMPDPDTALLRLIAFTVLSPLALSFLLTTFALVVVRGTAVVEPLVRPLRLPDAVPLPLTASITIMAVWALRDVWLPPGLDLLAAIARAWVVWSAARPTGLF
jgi:hypothetical protein